MFKILDSYFTYLHLPKKKFYVSLYLLLIFKIVTSYIFHTYIYNTLSSVRTLHKFFYVKFSTNFWKIEIYFLDILVCLLQVSKIINLTNFLITSIVS